MSDTEDSLKGLASGVGGELVWAAKDGPDWRAAGAEVGKAVLTVTMAINVCVIPLAVVNFGLERAKHYFQNQFPEDMQRKLADVPEEALVEPAPSVAGPALQGLAYSTPNRI